MKLRSAALLCCAVLSIACAPVVSRRGYQGDPVAEAGIKIGGDTKTTVQQRLGDPSTQATFGTDSWYYISSTEKQVAFFDPRVEKRSILAIHFDRDGRVADIRHYSLKDGHVVAFETNETPAKGKELTFLQQLFNATPGVPITPGQQGGGAPGGGGPGR